MPLIQETENANWAPWEQSTVDHSMSLEVGGNVRLGQLTHHIVIALPKPSGTAKTTVEIRTWSRTVPGATRQTRVSDGNIVTYQNVVGVTRTCTSDD
jgi:hypothetical protein